MCFIVRNLNEAFNFHRGKLTITKNPYNIIIM